MSRFFVYGIIICVLLIGAFANAADIVWVSEVMDEDGDGNNDDYRFVELLEAEGHTVYTDPGQWANLDEDHIGILNDADLVIFGRSTNSGGYAGDNDEITQWNSIETPLILLNAYVTRTNRWLWIDSEEMVQGGSVAVPVLEAVDPGHPIFLGLLLDADNQIQVLDPNIDSGEASFISSVDMGNGVLIARAAGADWAFIAEWDEGVEFYDGAEQTAGERRMLFTAGTQSATAGLGGVYNLTEAGQNLFINAVNYMLNAGPRTFAYSPKPVNEATDVLRDGTVLSWRPGSKATTHDVYFGKDVNIVSDADRDNPLDVLIVRDHPDNQYPLGRLDLGETYYWRIDEINDIEPNSPWQGPTWSFTVEPFSYPIPAESITATASSAKDDNSGPEKTIDGSGLDGDGHSIASTDMWLSASGDGAPWIQYEFDGVYKLDKMSIWNSNQRAESVVGYGVKDVQAETSVDGTSWTVLTDITQLTRAPGSEGAGPTDSFDLGGMPVKYVRFTIANNWGGILTQYSLSEVRFYYMPVQAREPVPASGATGILPDAVFSWRAGREAGSHEVFVAMDVNAVLDGSAPSATVADNRIGLAPFDLSLGETYAWKVNEINDVEDPSVWEGPVWNFSLPSYLVVDDFEGYSNEIPQRPYVTWRDGLDFSQPAPGGTGNDTGSQVGHDIFSLQSPYFGGELMESDLIHGGSLSLPFYYDNSGANGKETYSEATRTFTPAQNWSGNAIATLTLYFRGMPGNTGQLYVKINDAKVLFTDDPDAISRPLWKQWNIDLTATGEDLSSVLSLSVGIEDPGSGRLLLDDFLLYRDAPPVVQGIDPGNAGLIASYSMENNVNDGTGSYNGTAVGNPPYDQGPSGYGMALLFDGIEDHVDLPIGPVLSTLSDITVASWVKWSGEGEDWQRVFDFGQSVADTNEDPNDFMFLTVNSSFGPIRFGITNGGNNNLSFVDGLVALPNDDWHHMAATIDSSTMTMTLYVDGSVVGTGPTDTLPQDVGDGSGTDQNWLGRSQWDGDAFFDGALDEVLIYDRALSEAEVRYLVGEQ